jgi:hypothetical protein
MADVLFDEYYGDIALQVPGAPEPLIDRAIVRATRTLCYESEYWRVTTDPMMVRNGVVELDLPTNSEIVRPLWVRLGERELKAHSDHSLIGVQPGRPRGYVVDADLLTLVPQPDGVIDERVTARLVLQPTRSAPVVPEAVGRRFYEAIVSGALSYLCAQVDQPWGNAELAQLHAGGFQLQIALARRRAGSEGAHVPRSIVYGGL